MTVANIALDSRNYDAVKKLEGVVIACNGKKFYFKRTDPSMTMALKGKPLPYPDNEEEMEVAGEMIR
jgi:hypothetical protein